MLDRDAVVENLRSLGRAFGALTIQSCAAQEKIIEMIGGVFCFENMDNWEIGKRISQYREELEKILSWVKPLEDKFLKEEQTNG